MSDLTEFLLARITEDEEVARSAVRWSEGASQWADDGEPDWQHIARWDPSRVLAECEAKRRIVELRQRAEVPRSSSVTVASQDDGFRQALDEALRLLALPYADHPSYDESWRP